MVHKLSLQTCTSTNSVNCLTRSLGDSELISGDVGSGSISWVYSGSGECSRSAEPLGSSESCSSVFDAEMTGISSPFVEVVVKMSAGNSSSGPIFVGSMETSINPSSK